MVGDVEKLSGRKSNIVGIKQLARHLDISIGTVSRAINGRPDVNEQTRKRVLEAAATLGYAPNQSGRSLRKGATGVIAAIIPAGGSRPLGDTIFMTVLDGLRAELVKYDLELVILLCGAEEDPFAFLRRTVERGLSDGIIISDTQRVDPRIEYLVEKKIPFVSFGRSSSNMDRAWVDFDFAAVARRSVNRLVDHGHKHIVLATRLLELNYGHVFENAYREALAERGIDVDDDLIIRTQSDEVGGYALGEKILGLGKPVDAVILVDETMALGLYKRLSEAQIKPGQDISIVGFLERMSSRFVEPPLSSYRVDLRGVGQALGQAMLPQLASSPPEMRSEKFVQKLWPASFVEGGSIKSA